MKSKSIDLNITENYSQYKKNVFNKIYKWLAIEQKKSEWKKEPKKHWIHQLVGEAGTGKIEYLKSLSNDINCEFKIKPKWIKSAIKIKHKGLYIFDAVNEVKDFNVEELNNASWDNDSFVIYAGWKEYDGAHNVFQINASEKFLHSNWQRISSIFKEYNFSLREKYLMSSVRNIEKLATKQPQSLLWKAFENVFNGHTRPRQIKNFYKKIAKINPLFLDIKNLNKPDKEMVNWLIDKHILQKNQGKISFSHPSISAHLYFRNKTASIKDLNFNKLDINVISTNHSSLLWWMRNLNKSDEDFLQIFITYNLKIKVSCMVHIKKELIAKYIKKLKFQSLDYFDVFNLEKLGFVNILYKEYLKENFDTSKRIPYRKKSGLLTNLMYALLRPSEGDDQIAREILNSNRINHYEKIIWDNSTKRKQMLNYILIKSINFYIEKEISAVSLSNLNNLIYSRFDMGNKFNFHKFVLSHWKKYDKGKVSMLDGMHNSSSGRSHILEHSRVYKDIDKRYKNSRNSTGKEIFDIGHKYVNWFLYKEFEESMNPIYFKTKKEMIGFGHPVRKWDSTAAFIKFNDLIFNAKPFYYANAIPRLEKWDETIMEPPCDEIINALISNNNEVITKLLRKYILELRKQTSILSLELEGNSYASQNGRINLKLVASSKNLYDPSLTLNDIVKNEYIIGTFDDFEYKTSVGYIITTSKKRTINKYSCKIEFDDFTNSYEQNDKFLEIDLSQNEIPNEPNIPNDDSIDSNYEKYQEELLPVLRKYIESNNKVIK